MAWLSAGAESLTSFASRRVFACDTGFFRDRLRRSLATVINNPRSSVTAMRLKRI